MWLLGKAGELQHSTHRDYELAIARVWKPAMGSKRLTELTRADLKARVASKTCGLKQTVFNITAKRGTVVYVQISGKQQKTVNTRKIRL